MFDKFPYTNFHELNLDYFINKFNEIFTEWEQLNSTMLEWKAATDASNTLWKSSVESGLAAWKTATEADLNEREIALRAELAAWKTATEVDIETWETDTLAALDAWKTTAEATFEAIQVQAAASATAAQTAQTAAETAQTAAETAQTAAETAATSVSASAAQIATNTGDISDLKNALSSTDTNINGGYFTVNDGITGYYNADGEYTSHTNYKCSSKDVMNVSSVSYEVLQAMGGQFWPVLFVDADDEVISRGARSVGEFTVSVPSNCAKILMNFSTGYVESYSLNSASVRPDKTLTIENRPADAKTVGDLFGVFDIEKVPDEVQIGTTNNSYYLGNDGTVKASTDEKYKVIVYAVTMGTAYKLYATHARIRSDLPMAGFSQATFAADASFTTLVMGSNTETDYNVNFVAPANGYIFVAQYDTRTTLSVATAKNACVDLIELNEKIVTSISGKKFLSIGDSLTNLPGGGTGSGKRWQNKIVSMLDMDSFITSGAIGLTVIKTGDNSIWQAVQNLTYDSTVGLISFWGGTNDFIYDAELGDFDEQADITTRDETTFYGAAFDCFEKLLTLYPTIPIFAIGTTQRIFNYENYLDSNGRVNNAGLHVYDYADALKKVAEYYSIPFVDLYKTSGINKYTLPIYMFAQTSNDHTYYLHLSNDGEDKVGNRLCAFLKATLN